MTNFRVSARLLAGVTALALLATGPTAAQDATGPPRGLGGSTASGTAEDPTGDAAAMRTLGARPGVEEDTVDVGVLSGIDDSGIGLLEAGAGGFGPDIWQGSERWAIELLLAAAPVGTSSATMNDMLRRLLLTAAPIPAGITGGSPILSLRLERLFAAGEVDAVHALAQQSLAAGEDATVALYSAWSDLTRRRSTEACATAAALTGGRDRPDWVKLRTLCLALAGETAAADLSAGLLEEQGAADPLFSALALRLTTGGEIALPPAEGLDPVHIALMAETSTQPAEADLIGAAPVLLAMIADDDRFPLDLRLAAGERAVASGALGAESLAALYDGINFDEAAVDNALSQAAELPPARGNALLYRAVKTLTVPSAAAEALREAVERARRQGLYEVAARLYWPVLRGVEPSPAFAAISPDMGRFALIAGDVASARAWYDLARQSIGGNAEEVRNLQILLIVADGEAAWRGTEAAPWLNEAAGNPDLFTRRVVDILTLEAMGFPLTSDIRTRMLAFVPTTQGVVPPAAVLSRLVMDGNGMSRGETVLLCLAALGPEGPAAASPHTLAVVIHALRSIGLDAEARALVVEGLLARQVAAAPQGAAVGEELSE